MPQFGGHWWEAGVKAPSGPVAPSACCSTQPLLSCLLGNQCPLAALLGSCPANSLLVPSSLSSSFLWFFSSSHFSPASERCLSVPVLGNPLAFMLPPRHSLPTRPSHSLSSRILDSLLFSEDPKCTFAFTIISSRSVSSF